MIVRIESTSDLSKIKADTRVISYPAFYLGNDPQNGYLQETESLWSAIQFRASEVGLQWDQQSGCDANGEWARFHPIPEHLFVVTIFGGSYDQLPPDSSIWCDLGNPHSWRLLCSKKQAKALLSGEWDGVSVEVWDGEPFGDGNCGAVASKIHGLLDCSRAFGSVGSLPAGWRKLH